MIFFLQVDLSHIFQMKTENWDMVTARTSWEEERSVADCRISKIVVIWRMRSEAGLEQSGTYLAGSVAHFKVTYIVTYFMTRLYHDEIYMEGQEWMLQFPNDRLLNKSSRVRKNHRKPEEEKNM